MSMATGWSRCGDRVFVRFSAGAHHYASSRGTWVRGDPMFLYIHPYTPRLSFFNVNSLYPALFSPCTRLVSGFLRELILYYHKLKIGAVGKGSELATRAIGTGKSLITLTPAELVYTFNNTVKKRCVVPYSFLRC